MTAKQEALIKEIDKIIISFKADKRIIEILGDEGINGLNDEAHEWFMHYQIDKLVELYKADYTE
jgi:hypothetical protein